MSRFAALAALLLCGALTALPLHTSEAATKKKKSTSTSAKKKTPSPAAKASADAAKVAAGASALDLPLPEKSASGGAAPSPAPAPEKRAAPPGAPEATAKKEPSPNATIEPDSIAEFVAQPPRVQQLIRDAIDLTRLNLTYTFGSADPDSGGMDCSGTMFYVLNAHGFTNVARDSRAQYLWTRKSGGFYPVLSKNEDGPEFAELLPGDLMFWTGTYELADKNSDLPISHVMLYLGREKEGGQRIMFGSSNGRTYRGVPRNGVSIFDFRIPKFDPAKPADEQSIFVGFARIPGLRTAAQLVEGGDRPKPPEEVAAKPTPAAKKTSSSSSKSKKKRR